MDRLAAVIAALEAGKLPSQEQISRLIDFIELEFLAVSLSRSVFEENAEESHDGEESPDPGVKAELSLNGVALARCTRSLLEAYKKLGEHKNGDNIIQRILWHLSQASNASKVFNSPYSPSFSSEDYTTSIYPSASISTELAAVQSSLYTLVYALWSSAVQVGASNVWDDLFLFLRLSLADVAERVEVEVARGKKSLRGMLDDEGITAGGDIKDENKGIEVLVREERDEPDQEGEFQEDESSDEDEDFEDARDQFEYGMRIATEALQSQADRLTEYPTTSQARGLAEEAADAKAKLESALNTLKGASSIIFQAPRKMKAAASQISMDTISSKLLNAYNEMCDRALSNPEYHAALETLFAILERWVNCSLDTMDTHLQHQPKLADFVEDPTPERHLAQALDLFATLLERFCGGASLSSLLGALRNAAIDVRKDEDLRTWFDEFFAYTRKSFSEPGFSRSDGASIKRKDLGSRMRAMRKDESPLKKQWLRDIEQVKNEVKKLGTAFQEDEDLKNIREAHREFASSSQAKEAARESLAQQMSWFWADVLKVYLPKLVKLVKDVPVPRTEYKDEHVEFVFENLNISTLSVLPAHTYVQNVTDLDLETPRGAESVSTTKLGTSTNIKLQAVEVDLSDLSFWCLEKISGFVVSGLVGIEIPPKGIDVDILLRFIQDDEERRKIGHFHTLERCDVHISRQATLTIKQSNHGILFTLFRGMMVNRLRDAIEKALKAQLQSAVMLADSIAYDVKRRREKLKEDGVDEGTALVMAVWAQFGKLGQDGKVKEVKKEEEGERDKAKIMFSATGTGVVLQSAKKGEEGRAFAIGIEPQILGGEKRGPMGTASQKLEGDKILADVKEDVKENAEEAAQEAGESVKNAVRQIKSFGLAVEAGRLEEETRVGWESEAFDF